MRAGLLALMAVALPSAEVAAEPDQSVVQVQLVQTPGSPGEQAAVPLRMLAPTGVDVGTLLLTVRIPKAVLTFSEIVLGGLALGVDAEASVTQTVEGDASVVGISIATAEKDGARAAIPTGPIGDLVFKVAKDAATGITVPIALTARASGTAAGAKPIAVETHDGELVVAEPFVFSCFFYMH